MLILNYVQIKQHFNHMQRCAVISRDIRQKQNNSRNQFDYNTTLKEMAMHVWTTLVPCFAEKCGEKKKLNSNRK